MDDITYKTPYGGKPLHIFDKANGYIKKSDKTKFLGLFQYDEKTYMNIKIDSGDDLPLEKALNI